VQFNGELWRKQQKKLWILSIFGLCLVSWVAFLWNLGNIGFIDKTEALYVEVARQMVLSNNWISPHWNDNYFYSYPAGGYWFLGLSFKLFGVTEWAARFPVALSAIAVVFLVFYTLRYFGFIEKKPDNNSWQLWITAWIGGGMMALNPAWIAWGRVAVSDMLLSSAIALAMLLFFLGYAQPENPKIQKKIYILLPIITGIAVLVKGPIGFILPILGIGSFLLYVGKFWEIFWEINPIRTIILFLVVALPWYVAATIIDGEIFVNEFLAVSNFKRFTNVVFNHPGPWYYYIIWGAILMLPWSVYFPLSIANLSCWQWKKVKESPRNSQLGLFCFAWFITTFVFFSAAATKLQGYILPVTPAVVIIITLFWGDKFSQRQPQKENNWLFLVTAILNIMILAVLAIASAISGKLVGDDPSAPTLADNLVTSGIPIISVVSWGLGAIIGIILLFKKRLWRWLGCVNLVAFFAFATFVFPPLIPLLDNERQLSFRELSIQVKQEIQPDEEVFLIGFTRYSLVYYSQHPINFVNDSSEIKKRLTEKPNKANSILILAESNYLQDSDLRKTNYELVSEKGAYKLIRVNKNNL
jgi:4-amino-4-deoxy-L-arabinose transferase-like glycosyltransferase